MLLIEMDSVIFWVRTVSGGTKDRVPMFYKGRWDRSCSDGDRGDVKARPTALGPGEFTATFAPDDFEDEAGAPIFRRRV